MLTLPPQLGLRGRRAFTLIEMLVVIAITIILFALLLRPLVTSLRLTQRAQLLAAATSAANITLERVTRELGSAVYVFDNTGHPFTVAGGVPNLPSTTRLDRFTDFLDLEMTDAQGNPVVAHAYNAKLDFVPARHADSNLKDPTTGDEPIQLRPGGGSASLSNTGLLFPLGPSSTITRYFIGLKRPVDYSVTPAGQGLYSNSNEGNLAAASSQEDNTYILYSVTFAPYKKQGTTYGVNTDLLAKNAQGKPELDDPDFFRYVTGTDVNWLSDDHHNYTAAEAADHNTRVENWVKIAKPVITQPDMDLLLLPHNTDGSIAYDQNAPFQNIAHTGVAHDPVGNKDYPIVNTSVNFRPAIIAADAAPGSTAEYASLGFPSNPADANGLVYVPTQFTASNRSWTYPYSLTLYQYSDPTSYTTDIFQDAGSSVLGNINTSPGDIMEYRVTTDSSGNVTDRTPVFDVTQGVVLAAGNGGDIHHYVPLSINPDTGAMNFDTPALPAPANQNTQIQAPGYRPYQRFWSATPDEINQGTLLATRDVNNNPTPGIVDLTQLYCNTDGSGTLVTAGGANTSPLPRPGQAPTDLQCANAVIVPGSVRIYGPDATPGPNYGQSVPYSQVSPGTPLSENQYRVDYVNNTVTFYVTGLPPVAGGTVAAGGEQLPTTQANGSAAAPVRISFNYQANLAPTNPANPISLTNPARPYRVKVDYQTRDLLDINIGVRVYDPSQGGRAVIVPVSNRVRIGNSNR